MEHLSRAAGQCPCSAPSLVESSLPQSHRASPGTVASSTLASHSRVVFTTLKIKLCFTVEVGAIFYEIKQLNIGIKC